MIVTLPLPPTANLYWRIWRGRAVMSEEARAYRVTAALSAKAQGMTPILKGNVVVSLRIFRPARRGDLDNRLKVLLDALRGIAYLDDSQVAGIQAAQFEDKENPRVEVLIIPAGRDEEIFSDLARKVVAKKKAVGPLIRSADWKAT